MVTWGCSGRSALSGLTFYPVKGKVTLPDGKTMPGLKSTSGGRRTTRPRRRATGRSRSRARNEGLPAGDYKISLEIAYTAKATKNATLPFPSRYLDEDFSGLTAKVTADGPNDFEFKLTKDSTGTDRPRGSGRMVRQGP